MTFLLSVASKPVLWPADFPVRREPAVQWPCNIRYCGVQEHEEPFLHSS
jgi:hypothetical protein